MVSISDYPTDEEYYSSGAAESNYTFTAFIADTTGLQNGEGVELTFSGSAEEEGGIYIDEYFVREEDGKSYVLKQGEDGTLVKQYVKTGKSLWGSYIEIKAGLSESDLIAFPYGKTGKEGIATTEVDYIGY